MRPGRVSRSVRQWGNFCFLLLLVGYTAWFAWQQSLRKVMEIPPDHVMVTFQKSLLFWRAPKVTVRREGRHPLEESELEEIQQGRLVCHALRNRTYQARAVVDISDTLQGLKALVGMGDATFVNFVGSISLDVDAASVQRVASEDFTEELRDASRNAIERSVKHLREEHQEKFEEQVALLLRRSLEIPSVAMEIESIEYSNEGEESLTLTDSMGVSVAPKVLDEMPAEGYINIGFAVFLTTAVYGFVRVVFPEAIGLIFVILIGAPLSALGFGGFALHEPGYYQHRRANRSRAPSPDYSAADAGLEALSTGAEIVSSPEVGDIIDMAEAVGDFGDAVGSMFDGLGALGELF